VSGLALLLLAAAATACGVWASLKSRPPAWAAVLGAILFAGAGVLSILASWVAGDGVVLPGRQLSPGVVAFYLSEATWKLVPTVGRTLILLGPFAHLLLVLVKRDKGALLRPLPATVVFLWLFLAAGSAADQPTTVIQARGPGRVAYLTVATREEGVRMILAEGEPFDTFLKIVHVHDAEGTPPELHLHWTNDGQGLVIRLHEEADPAFAVDLEGNVTGMLPAEAREWTKHGAFVPRDVSQRLSQARLDVNKFVHAHGGLAPP